jgi:hypothetical protein
MASPKPQPISCFSLPRSLTSHRRSSLSRLWYSPGRALASQSQLGAPSAGSELLAPRLPPSARRSSPSLLGPRPAPAPSSSFLRAPGRSSALSRGTQNFPRTDLSHSRARCLLPMALGLYRAPSSCAPQFAPARRLLLCSLFCASVASLLRVAPWPSRPCRPELARSRSRPGSLLRSPRSPLSSSIAECSSCCCVLVAFVKLPWNCVRFSCV